MMGWTRLIKKGLIIPLCVSLLLHAGILLLIHTAGPVKRSVTYHEAAPALTTYVQLHRLQPIADREPEHTIQAPEAASTRELDPHPGSPSETSAVPASPPELTEGPDGASPADPSKPEAAERKPTQESDRFDAGVETANTGPAGKNNPFAVGQGSSQDPPRDVPAEAAHAVIIEENLQRLIRELIEARKRYPEAARRRGEEGAVELRLAVDPDGRLRDCTLYRPSGSTILDRDAVKLVQSIFPIEESIDGELSTLVKIDYSLH
ncbi:MAG: TonB family protein [Spirochaetota bacterium]|nr:TonB family protein [Spirochaetota bacterium]